MNNILADDSREEIGHLRNRIDALESRLASIAKLQYLPMPPFVASTSEVPFMSFSTCNAADVMHPRFQEICGLLKHPFCWHRKMWEWVFVIHHLLEAGAVKPGSRGLVFGVGNERLPALFASMGAKILATDAPNEATH